jgi:formylglycine-generating enzyme required for sulfatase activity
MMRHLRSCLALVVIATLVLLAGRALAQTALPREAIVRITASFGGSTATGTGFIVRLDRNAAYIVTGSHVIAGDSSPKVEFYTRQNFPVDGRVAPGAELADRRGLAIVIVDAPLPAGLGVLPLAERSISLQGGEDVLTIGHPQRGGRWAVIKGYVTSRQGRVTYIDAAIDQGNSGGPLLSQGKVVGVVTGKGPVYGEAVSALALLDFLAGSGITPSDQRATDQAEQARRKAEEEARRRAAEVEAQRKAEEEAKRAAEEEARRKAEEEAAPRRESALSPRQTFKDCPECPEMVVVPAGRFTMGSDSGENGNERPAHQVVIPRPFAVGKFEITHAQFAQFVRDSGHDAGSGWRDNKYSPSDQHPVVEVSWKDAEAYVKWLAKKTGYRYHLLSEAEWEYLARAGTTTEYWWGNDVKQGGKVWANCDGCGSQWDGKQTAPVGSFAPNPFGLYNTAGNVLEWIEDCSNDNYIKAPTDGSAWTSGSCELRIVRGGSWIDEADSMRSASRSGLSRNFRSINLGFRVARTLP